MKKIINGKVYDTSTAQKLASAGNSNCSDGMARYSEVLYRKRTGEYFLHGSGGAMTKYATSLGGGSWGSGESIIPLSYAEATEWAETHLDGDKYEEIFGQVVEDETRRTVTYSIAAASAERFKREAARRGITIGALLDELATSFA